MNPVINPWLFYAMDVCGVVKIVFILAAVAIVLYMIVSIVFDWLKGDTRESFDVAVIGLVISVIFAVGIPSSETIMKMIVAQNVTYERVEVAGDTVKDVYEDIMELFGKE